MISHIAPPALGRAGAPQRRGRRPQPRPREMRLTHSFPDVAGAGHDARLYVAALRAASQQSLRSEAIRGDCFVGSLSLLAMTDAWFSI